MNFYIILYFLTITASIWWWFLIKNIYKNNLFWNFFLSFTIFASIWFSTYFLFYSWIQDKEILLILVRTCYLSWILSSYSLLFSVIFFNKSEFEYKLKISIIILIGILLTIFYVKTDLIISKIEYAKWLLLYREVYWSVFSLNIILYIIFWISFIYYSYKTLKTQAYINKIRLKYIILSWFIGILTLIFFQLILPLFWIWILEKEVILILLWFVVSIVYITQRYFFTNISYWIWKILLLIMSMWWAILLTNYLIYYYKINNWYWWWIEQIWVSNIIIAILIFIWLYNFLSRYILWTSAIIEFKNSINALQKRISYSNSIQELNIILNSEIQKTFKTNYSEVCLYEWDTQENELKKYFENINNQKVFINDLVFIEENKNKFDKVKIIWYIPHKSFLIFPIFNRERKNIWTFSLWTKPFWDFYTKNEIDWIKSFIFFLEYHIRYIKNYKIIKDLSVNLDKKVDEKTMEYNNLINRQKEFISVISHEIRSPISSAIFQWDSIIDDIDCWENDLSKIKTEINILNNILVKIWDLSSKLFSASYYETHEVGLYKEKILFDNLINNEIDIFSRVNWEIEFNFDIEEKIGFVEIDKIQFVQVIENILANAVKFVNKKDWIINVTVKKQNGKLIVIIEDNWKGFVWITTESVFDKYSTWNWWSVWLWMWLYLCKKIINMHNWEIYANVSDELWWAKFTIEIPID